MSTVKILYRITLMLILSSCTPDQEESKATKPIKEQPTYSKRDIAIIAPFLRESKSLVEKEATLVVVIDGKQFEIKIKK